MSELFDPIFGATAVSAATDDRAWLGALCEVEIALARACARVGRIELATALEIGAAADELSRGDPAELGRQSVDGADPVSPLVAALRQRVGERAGAEAAAAVHLGASSQDVLDTAAMLIAQRALGVILAELDDCAAAAAELARVHRSLPMIGRTLPAQVPGTTFGALAAVWGNALDRAVDRLSVLRDRLPAQLGGPTGTLAAWHPHGLEVAAALADELGLAEPDGVWHTDRSVLAELAGALGAAAATVATTADNIVLLARPELGEVRESTPEGAATHPPHPVAAVTARATAAQAPGLVATLLASGAHGTPGAHELQHGIGPWPTEWPPLIALLRAVGGSASRLRTSLTGLIVDTAAMRRNLTGSEVGTGHAEDLVDRYLARRTG